MQQPILLTIDNLLIRGTQYLTSFQIDLLHIFISRIAKNDAADKIHEIEKKELIRLLGLEKSNSAHAEIRKAAEILQGHIINLKAGQGLSYDNVNVLSNIENLEGSTSIKFTFHPKLVKYIVNLTGNYTTVELTAFLRFKSLYSKRLYLYLKSYSQGFEITKSIEELNELLQTPNSLKQYYSNFKNKVLKPVLEDLIFTDRPFTFIENKKGKKVVSITFKLFKKEGSSSDKPKIETNIIASNANLKFVDMSKEEWIHTLVVRYELDKETQAVPILNQVSESELKDILKRFAPHKEQGKGAGYLVRMFTNNLGIKWPKQLQAIHDRTATINELFNKINKVN